MSEPLRPPPPERDPALDAAWRAHSTELPPPAIDAAILAAAHREVGSRPRAAGDEDTLAEAREPSRWWWGLAAAATIGAIAFGLVQLASFDGAQDPTRASDMPSEARAPQPAAAHAPATAEAPLPAKPETATAPASGLARIDPPKPAQAPAAAPPPAIARTSPAATPATPSPPAPVPRPAPPPLVPQTGAESAAERPAARQRAAEAPALESRRDDAAPRPFPMQAAPVPPSAAGSVAKQESGAPASTSGERVAEPMAKRAAPAALAADAARSSASAASAEGRAAAPPSPEAFVQRIREHYDAGRFDAAARELRAFREAFADADARLPPELRAWAASIRN